MSGRRTRQQVKTYTRGQLPQSKVLTESQRINSRKRAAEARARVAERRGNQFEAAMHRREAAKLAGLLEKTSAAQQEPTRDILTATCDWDFRWVRQRDGDMNYQKVGV